jgi:hypothetical protein
VPGARSNEPGHGADTSSNGHGGPPDVLVDLVCLGTQHVVDLARQTVAGRTGEPELFVSLAYLAPSAPSPWPGSQDFSSQNFRSIPDVRWIAADTARCVHRGLMVQHVPFIVAELGPGADPFLLHI